MRSDKENGEEVPHFPQNRDSAISKLRRGRKHCPVCLTKLTKNATRTRLAKKCLRCQAQLSKNHRCAKCGASAVWTNKTDAACQSCGSHGKKAKALLSQP